MYLIAQTTLVLYKSFKNLSDVPKDRKFNILVLQNHHFRREKKLGYKEVKGSSTEAAQCCFLYLKVGTGMEKVPI